LGVRLQTSRPPPVRPTRLQPLHHPLHRLVAGPAQPGRGPVAAQLSVGVEDVQLLPRVLQWRGPPVRRRWRETPTPSPTGAAAVRPSGQPRGADFEMATAADSNLAKDKAACGLAGARSRVLEGEVGPVPPDHRGAPEG